ncbi:unnamed protein product [Rhodiola kirilowii]
MGSKKVITDSSSADRISDLPSDIISCILDRTPIRDAVATSILSRDWRHKWRRIGNLVFDEKFADDVIFPRMEGDERIHLEYGNIIGSILLHHIGPIQKFVLQIAYDYFYPEPLDLPSDLLSSWMLLISQKEVKELIIQAPYEIINLPSYIFHCDQLQHLKVDVDTLTIHLPRDFRGFCCLISLDLSLYNDGSVISNLISKCPLLERLSLNVTSLSHPLVIDAPRLRFLNVDMDSTLLMSGDFDLDSDVLPTLMNVRSVTDISLKFYRRVMDFCYMISIFGSVPKVETIVLRPPQKLVDMPPDAPMRLPTTLHNHKSLTLLEIGFSSPQCIYFVLCILKSSPNLQMLNLQIRSSGTSEDEAALHFLDMQAREPLTLNNLLTVKMKWLSGRKVEIMLIKMILSCSPILKMMHLNGDDTFNEAELLQFPRSSSRAQVSFSLICDPSIFAFFSCVIVMMLADTAVHSLKMWTTEMGSKQISKDSSLPDRISDLPSNIIECILDRLPIRDAVATSVLSRDWRHKWRRIGNLIFDSKFLDDVIYPRISLDYGDIIGGILVHHLGPIQKFVLQIPSYIGCNTLPLDLLNSWMLFISRNEVKELTIEAPGETISLPSYLFHSNELQHLKLNVRRLEIHPQGFRAFCNLISLDLSAFYTCKDKVVISNLISECPRLERLSLEVAFFKEGPMVIDAPRLRFLKASFLIYDVMFLTLKNVRSVTDISLEFGRCVMDFCYLISFLGSVPIVETVTLYLPRALVDMPPDAPMSLPTTLHNLKSLTLLEMSFSSPQCIYFVLCILKSSPNLQVLNLRILSYKTSEEKDDLHFLDMQTRETHILKSLLTVKIKGLLGSKIGIMFVKLILSCSPVLETMFLTGVDARCSCLGKDILNEAELTLMSELLHFRSSTRAQVIYSTPPGDSFIFDF